MPLATLIDHLLSLLLWVIWSSVFLNWAPFLLCLLRYPLACLARGRLPPKEGEGKKLWSPKHRFAVLIPAHNEGYVLPYLLDALNMQSYPRDLYTVYVAADRCTDDTVQVGKAKGAHVTERWEGPSGKSWNIRYALERIPLAAYDYLVVVDADNLVPRDFLAELDRFLQENPDTKAVQAYLDTKNPSDSWLTRAIALAYWLTNLAWFRPREMLGLSVTLGGTGMAIASGYLRERGWNARTLTEDLEMHVNLVLEGERVRYCERAKVYDEKPLTLKAAYRQRVRWLQGHWYLFFARAWPLLKIVLRPRERSLGSALDALQYLFIPARYLMMLVYLLLVLLQAFFLPPEENLHHFRIWMLQLLFIFAIGAGTFSSFARYRKLKPGIVLSSLVLIPFGFVWLLASFEALTKFKKQEKWVKTQHIKTIKLDELDPGV